MNIKGHFETITRHKLLVMKYCFECGLYQQGLTHDLSKYSPTEFIPGCIYYQGDHSPNEAEREARGYTSAWLHHKGRNKHHLEYWIDYSTTKAGLTGMKIPLRYVCEMVCDRVAASQIYLGDKYTDASAWEYYQRSKDHYLMHPETRALLEKLLLMLREYVDDTVDSTCRIDCMQCGEYQMSCFSSGDGDTDCFKVTHFSDENNIRIFTKCCSKTGFKA